jgi:hypothetical protein
MLKHGERTAHVIAGGKGKGDRTDQLNNPTDMIVDHGTGSLIICDRGNRRVVRWSHHNGNGSQARSSSPILGAGAWPWMMVDLYTLLTSINMK